MRDMKHAETDSKKADPNPALSHMSTGGPLRRYGPKRKGETSTLRKTFRHEQKLYLVQLQLSSPNLIEGLCPADGPQGENCSILYERPMQGNGLRPRVLHYGTPLVLESIADKMGWQLEAVRALGKRFSSMQQGGVYPMLPLVFVAIKTRCRLFHNQDVWGYLNASLPIEEIVPVRRHGEMTSAIVFPSGHVVYSPWTASTVQRKISLAKRVGMAAGWGMASAVGADSLRQIQRLLPHHGHSEGVDDL